MAGAAGKTTSETASSKYCGAKINARLPNFHMAARPRPPGLRTLARLFH
jgi:hypothetical protein